MNRRTYRERGFTLIELTMVIVVLAILAGVALVRYQPAEGSVGYQADRLARDIRHMQILAITWGVTLRLTPAAGGVSYSVSCVVASATPPCNVSPVRDPVDGDPAAGGAFQYIFQNNVTMNVANLDIDALGRPVTGGTLTNNGADTQYTLTGGTNTSTVTTQRLTGFVSVVY